MPSGKSSTAAGSARADFDRWLYDLHDAGRRGAPPARMLSLAGKAIPYQLVLFDGSHALVAYEANGRAVPPSMRDVLEHGFAMYVSIEHQSTYRRQAQEHPAGFELEFDGDGPAVPLWVRPIRSLSGETYYLHVMGMHAEDLETRNLVDELALELASSLSCRPGQMPSCVHDDLVQALVTRRHTEPEIAQREDFSGWRREPGYRALRVLATRSFVPAPQWHHHAGAVAGFFLNAHASVMDDGLTLLVFGDARDKALSGIEAFDRYLVGNGLVAGESDWQDSLGRAPDAYRQACEAATLAREAFAADGAATSDVGDSSAGADDPLAIDPLTALRPRRERLVTYDECRFSLLLAAIKAYADANDVTPHALRVLARHDGEHGTAYAPTLLAYLRNLMGKTETCRELGIHRTTLDYRLERIATLADIDLGDTRQRDWLLVLALVARKR